MISSIHVTPESLSASSKSSVKMNLPLLQSKMKIDPECYVSELELIYNQFKSSLTLFQQQAALSFTSLSGVAADPSVSKDLGDRAMFLSHVTPFYPNQLKNFPQDLSLFLCSSARSLPSALRCNVAQALILLVNRKMVEIKEILALFMELQTLGDKNLRTLAFSHVIHSIKRMNQKHKNEAENRALQNILYPILQQEDEAKAKRALATLCELHRRKVWFDERTANEICRACFHASSRIMIAALSFLLDYENNQDNDDNSDGSESDDDSTPQKQQAVLSKQAVYKAHNQGTLASKKKKKAKLQRAMRSMKRQQRLASESSISTYYSPLNHLKDAQGFAEKLFSRLKTCNERFEVKMMMLKVIARTIGLHRLVVLSFYPYIQKYIQPHQRNVTNLLAAAIQTCHDMVPPDAIEPLFKQVVNQFVHDRSSPEAIAVGLNVVREICLRMPLLMTEDLLQDLVLYKKSHEKAVSIAARSLVTLFREICPSLLIKKDRGRPINPKARPREFGEVDVVCEVPGIELLQENDDDDNDDVDDEEDQDAGGSGDKEEVEGEDEDGEEEDGSGSSDDEDIVVTDDEQGGAFDTESEAGAESGDEDIDENETDEDGNTSISDEEDGVDQEDEDELEGKNSAKSADTSTQDNGRKRKLQDIDGQLNAADASLRALKRLAADPKMEQPSSDYADGFLTQEDFQRIKELKAKKEAKLALAKHGLLKKNPDAKSSTFKIPTSDQLSIKRVDPDMLEVNIRKKMSKEERLALVKAGREDRGKYQARAAVKQKKTGGLSNRQKEHKKAMPLAAKRKKVARSRQDKKKQKQRAGKQFRGRKAWK